MTTTVSAYAAPAAKAPLGPATVERRDVREFDVRIAITFVGICHSDVHQAREGWGTALFPMVPGHEITGIVTETGPGVTAHRPGDRVGVGCMVESCRVCENCRAGLEQYCAEGPVWTYNAVGRDGQRTYGGYAQEIVVDEHFVVRIPDALPLETAAPLLCAGITTYSPLRHWNTGPGRRVAVVGLGGLGHVAVRIGHALGAEVTVLSRSLRKKDDGLRLGAVDYRATADPATFEELAGRFDLVLNTVSAPLDFAAHLGLLRTDGALVSVGLPEEPVLLDLRALNGGRRSLSTSSIGGIAETQEMLDFCAAHGVAAEVELIGVGRINEAYDRVVAGDVRFRFVIDTATL
ncbi:NAD(P)-dependent alcohol dehydrogenase [Kitasatospora sp. NPDC058032]|uniref:NAD(P)-dependent alcohol dehydrogenase n=1 Tax=Kitasatospora sp. NPDC058032 TaxID=3346307 RepID=UPI0036DE7264